MSDLSNAPKVSRTHDSGPSRLPMGAGNPGQAQNLTTQPGQLNQPWKSMLSAEIEGGNNPWLNWKPNPNDFGEKPWLDIPWRSRPVDGDNQKPISDSDSDPDSPVPDSPEPDSSGGDPDPDGEPDPDSDVRPEMMSGYSVGNLRHIYRESRLVESG